MEETFEGGRGPPRAVAPMEEKRRIGEGPLPGICKGDIYSALDWRRASSRDL